MLHSIVEFADLNLTEQDSILIHLREAIKQTLIGELSANDRPWREVVKQMHNLENTEGAVDALIDALAEKRIQENWSCTAEY